MLTHSNVQMSAYICLIITETVNPEILDLDIYWT